MGKYLGTEWEDMYKDFLEMCGDEDTAEIRVDMSIGDMKELGN